MTLLAFYSVWAVLLKLAVAFGPVPRITWEHRGKKRNFISVMWDIAKTSGFCVHVLPACLQDVWSVVSDFAQPIYSASDQNIRKSLS